MKTRPTTSIQRTTLRPSEAASATSHSAASIGAMLPHPACVRSTCRLDRDVAGGEARRIVELGWVAVLAERPAGLVEPAQPEPGGSRRPRLCLPGRRPARAPGRTARSAPRGRARPRRCRWPPHGRDRVRRDSRRAAGRCRRPPGRTASGARSAGGSPRRSSRRPARTRDRTAARRRGCARARSRGATTPPRADSPPPPPRPACPRRQWPKKSPTASIVLSTSSSPWASETNMHSNCDGAR